MLFSLPMRLWGPLHVLATGRWRYRHRFLRSNVGKSSYVDPSVMIFGWQNVRVGDYTTICEDVWLNVNFRDDPDKKIIIGNNCHIAKDCYFSCGPQILVKDYCLLGFKCNLLGCGHKFDSPLVPYIASGLYPGKEIEIGVNCWLTGNVTVLEGVKIGRGSVIGAGSVVTQSVPPFSIALGNPCRVTRRFDFGTNRWIDVLDWHEEHERSLPSEAQYLQTLRARHPGIPNSLITSGRRFGWL